jgi:hypothetical protein
MRKAYILSGQITLLVVIAVLTFATQSCKEKIVEVKETVITKEVSEYFLLRPEVEKLYGYSHAVRIGDDLKISGAVSMDDAGNLTAAGDME